MTNCSHKKNDLFFLLLTCTAIFSYFLSYFSELSFFLSIREFVNITWPAVILSIVFVGILHYIPNSFIYKLVGYQGFSGIIRAGFAGILLDLCSHGILMVASKLYKKGLSNGQIIAFLIASPWNSISLTLILISLIGLKWSLLFIAYSFIIAVTTGFIFDILTNLGYLKKNPYQHNNKDFHQEQKLEKFNLFNALKIGVFEAKLIVKWLLFGILAIALIREFVSTEIFANFFAPGLKGLFFTIFIASIIEICSEGSAPFASDIFNHANAKGNSFAFLMAGVATDYTEIMVLKETTKSWRFALLVPIISIPQIMFFAYFMNFA